MKMRSVMLSIVLAAASLPADPVSARKLYRCEGAQGSSYQDRPCADEKQQQKLGDLPDADYSATAGAGWMTQERDRKKLPNGKPDLPIWLRPRQALPTSAQPPAPDVQAQQTSYRCTASDGSVFYRHQPCPLQILSGKSIRVDSYSSGGTMHVTTVPLGYEVKGEPVSRSEACRQIQASGGIGRRGSRHDTDVSSYDKNRGLDPCR